MADVIPFRGILYDVSKVSMEDVLAPPYDIITPEYREALYMQSAYNIVRIDFGKDEPGDNEKDNKYSRARKYLDAWLKEGIFIRDEQPSFYLYEMSYTIQGVRRRLLGFLGLVKLEELGKGSIYPHECTHSKPKQDRLNLMRSCEANTSPIFSLYKSPEGQIADILSNVSTTKPYMESADIGGDVHRLWQINASEQIEAIRKELKDKAIFIADGHHRYETAFEFSKEIALTQPSLHTGTSNYVLMFLANMRDGGITILPTHRLLREIPENLNRLLSEHFVIEPVKNDFDIRKRLSGQKHAFGFYQKGSDVWYILKYKGGDLPEIHQTLRDIDVIILHELILKKVFHTTDIGYEMDIKNALDKVNNGEFTAAFFLNPTRVEDVEKAALSSVRMPPKSTYFYPKLLTGLVINKWSTNTDLS
jgi:uncharacterized protein (DUF1015 family)